MEKRLDIGEVSATSGLRPSALRYYEEEGLIGSVGRESGRRQYEPSVLRRLEVIALCQEVGCTVAEIKGLLNDRAPLRRWRRLAEQKLVEVDGYIERAQATKALLEQVLACGCADPAGCGITHEVAMRRRH